MALLDGRVAIVTGAGRGLGREEALALAAEGARVIINDVGASVSGEGLDQTPAQAVVDEIERAGGEAIANYADISDWNQAQGVIDLAYQRFGQLDILVNNAGVLRDRMNFNMAEDEFDLVLKVHCKGHFAMTRHACARWRELAKQSGRTYGRIINTSSEAGLMGSAGNSNYAMAKAAIAALTISIGREMERYGVTANFIAPRARTRMTDTMPNSSMFDKPESGFDAFHPAWPAQLVVFLASGAAGDTPARVSSSGRRGDAGRRLAHPQPDQRAWRRYRRRLRPGAQDELFGKHPKQPGYM
ncbi:MAG: SDR family NAD(P)-dependent oxidoreductase [Candidatus Binatia bacterium]